MVDYWTGLKTDLARMFRHDQKAREPTCFSVCIDQDITAREPDLGKYRSRRTLMVHTLTESRITVWFPTCNCCLMHSAPPVKFLSFHAVRNTSILRTASGTPVRSISLSCEPIRHPRVVLPGAHWHRNPLRVSSPEPPISRAKGGARPNADEPQYITSVAQLCPAFAKFRQGRQFCFIRWVARLNPCFA